MLSLYFNRAMLPFVLLLIVLCLPHTEPANSTDCITPNKENAKCISIYSCDLFLKALRNATNSTIKFMRESQCGNIKVCCGKTTDYQIIDANATNDNIYAKPNSNWRPFASRNICGYQHTDDRYYNKSEIAIDEFPWVVQLLFTIHVDASDICVGSLISRRYVLTSAHCVTSRFTISSIRLGEHDKTSNIDCAINPDYPECADPTIDVAVEEIIPHPKFNRNFVNHNIALIRLVKNVVFSDYIRPICLPTAGYPNATVGEYLVKTGWGFTVNTSALSNVRTRSSNIIISLEECKEKYNTSKGVKLDDGIVCTLTDVEYGICRGDGGGPAMFKIGNQWQQEGIVSFGKSCGLANTASGNTRVPFYMDWIISTIKP